MKQLNVNIRILTISFILSLTSAISIYGQPASPVPLSPFTASAYALRNIGLGDYPYEETVAGLLSSPVPRAWKGSHVSKHTYLDMMEKIVRMAATWVDADGAVIDPYFEAEFGQTTPRFVSSASILLHFGRIEDLKPLVIRSMTYSCTRLANRTAESPDFWMRELSTAFICLEPKVSKKLAQSWEALFKKVDPEKTYKVVDPSGERLGQLHNWAVYSSGGEYTREAFGLTSPSGKFLQGKRFFDTYMQPQLVHFTKEGMYRDPNDPITYDITTRLQIANALAYGYDGALKDTYSELLRRGGLTMLLFTSPNGMAPYGGRSGQFQFQEGIIVALSELEANRYKNTNERLAGAFKRQAHMSALSMKRWIVDMDPLRHIKNGFIPEAQHGIDRYGKYSVYALYCSSVLGLAALYADDTVREYPAFSETGGYLFELYPAFHKVFAMVKDTHIEIDTKGDFHYESTGLGRFHFANVPAELGLSMSFTSTPNYRMADTLKADEPYAIGPAWKSHDMVYSLASLSPDLAHKLTASQITRDTIAFDIQYQTGNTVDATVHQRYKLFEQNVSITTRIDDRKVKVDSVYFIVPLLVSTGLSESDIVQYPGKVTVNYLRHRYTVEFERNSEATVDKDLFANRNGIYRNLTIRKPGNEMRVNLKLE